MIRPRHSAFTLIELAVCLILLGIMAAMTAVSLAGADHMHRMEDVVDRFRSTDHRARVAAVRFDRPTALQFDMASGIVTLDSHVMDKTNEPVTWTLPKSVRLTGVRVQDHTWAERQVEVRYHTLGYAPTYAIELIPERGAAAYCVVAGLTGYVSVVESKAQVDTIFEVLDGTR